jgi:hypothetical protein
MTDYNQQFDHLIPLLTKHVMDSYAHVCSKYKELLGDIDTSPLLNLTLSVFISSIINILDVIKKNTEGEKKLLENIDLTKDAFMKLLKDLPFVKGVEEHA